jgi:hypothetical protein
MSLSSRTEVLSGYYTPSVDVDSSWIITKDKKEAEERTTTPSIISIFIWSRTDSIIFYNTCETSSPLSETRCTRARERTIPATSFLNLNPLEIPFFFYFKREPTNCHCVMRKEERKRAPPAHTDTHTHPSITQWTREAQAQSHIHFRFHSFAQGTGLMNRESITVVTIVSVCWWCLRL